jgi:hypothetical protein
MPGLIQQHWLSPMGSNAVSRLLGNEARGLSTQVAIFAALTMGAPQAAFRRRTVAGGGRKYTAGNIEAPRLCSNEAAGPLKRHPLGEPAVAPIDRRHFPDVGNANRLFPWSWYRLSTCICLPAISSRLMALLGEVRAHVLEEAAGDGGCPLTQDG